MSAAKSAASSLESIQSNAFHNQRTSRCELACEQKAPETKQVVWQAEEAQVALFFLPHLHNKRRWWPAWNHGTQPQWKSPKRTMLLHFVHPSKGDQASWNKLYLIKSNQEISQIR
jgi:hypothetical protein